MNAISNVFPRDVYGNFNTQDNVIYAKSILHKITHHICNLISSSGSGAGVNASDFNNSLALQFDELMQLQDNWFEGGGFAPDKNKLSFIATYELKVFTFRIEPKELNTDLTDLTD